MTNTGEIVVANSTLDTSKDRIIVRSSLSYISYLHSAGECFSKKWVTGGRTLVLSCWDITTAITKLKTSVSVMIGLLGFKFMRTMVEQNTFLW